jgi:hypothetical protein
MREPQARVIYSNYNLYEKYPDDELREQIAEEQVRESNEITEDEICAERYWLDSDDWDCEKERLNDYFDSGNHFLAVGICGRWNGNFAGGIIFDTLDELLKIARDCDYMEFRDENGHLYFDCFHHDGTNSVEIKEITDRGWDYYQNWNYGDWNDKRTEQYIHKKIFEKYSRLPNFAHKYYGCKRREYKEAS